MNLLLDRGMNISSIWEKFPHYDYWEIYWSVSDFSLLGKKRIITNRINSVRCATTKVERDKLLSEINSLVTEMYKLTKRNGKKLVEIGKIINR
ncbi:hypothetical protein BVH06_09055 [Pseudomonas sp. PA27(2017)]|nr:hypothetical protein BVH06_09055 [Pseudomonas sp. PA27(2017)]